MAEGGVASNGQKRTPMPQPGLILYPALGNPELVSGSDSLHLLLCLTAKPAELAGDAGKQLIAEHLKFMSLSDSEALKLRWANPGTVHAAFSPSLVKAVGHLTNFAEAATPIWENAERRFYGIFRSAILKYFTSGNLHGYTDSRLAKLKPENVYHVTLDGLGLRSWLRKNLADAELADHCFVNWVTKPWLEGKADPADTQDGLPYRELEEEAVTNALCNVKLEKEPKYIGQRVKESCWAKIDAEDEALYHQQGPLRVFDIFEWRFNLERPLSILHPVFFYDQDKCLNVGYISDLHVVSRLEVLRRSDFQLIPGAPESESPKIASMVNSTARAVRDIMKQMAGKPSADPTDGPVDILAIGGDLVDFAMSSFPTGDALPDTLPAERARSMVDTESDSLGKRYDYGVDFMAMYQLVTEFYRVARKPVVILAGNHDAYDKPYGISPRAVINAKLANPGIPADNNLTLMEAILAFGDSYGSIEKSFNFIPHIMDCFYLLFTPIFSFTSKMSNMQWISLGWGDTEEMLWDGPTVMPGHLPNAEAAVSAAELPLIQKGVDHAAQAKVKCLMISHYTWACYEENYQEDGETVGSFPTGDKDNTTFYNMGTCEINRRPVYEHFQSGKIHYTISGHAHRAGVYALYDKMDSDGRVRVRGWPIEEYHKASGHGPSPYMIVSDSAGPLPRENLRNEFKAWGSNRPAGTKLTFDAAGHLTGLRRVQASLPQCKPRLAVTLDYMELMFNDFGWFFESEEFWLKKVEARPEIAQSKVNDMVDLEDDLIPIHIPPTVFKDVPEWVGLLSGAVYLLMISKGRKRLFRFPIVFDPAKGWCLRDKDFLLLRMGSDFTRNALMTIHLGLHTAKANGSTAPRYDTDSPWNVVVESKLSRASSGFLGLFPSGFSISFERVYDFVKYPKQSKYKALIP